MNLLDLQIEPLVRKRFDLQESHPKHEVIRLRQLARKHALVTKAPFLQQFFDLLIDTSAPHAMINQQIALLTATTPLRFITNSSGGNALHTLVRSTQSPKRMARIAKLLLALDPGAASVFDEKRQLPLQALVSTHKIINNELQEVLELLLKYYPDAKELKTDGLFPVDHVDPKFDRSTNIITLLTPTKRRQSKSKKCSIFDIVRSPYVPLVAFRKLLLQEPLSAKDSQDGYFPLEALVTFGSPTIETIYILFSLNPSASVSPTSVGSLLHLLLGNSCSRPTLNLVRCLCALSPISAVGKIVRGKDGSDPLLTLAKRRAYLKQGRRHTNVDDPKELHTIVDFLTKGRDMYTHWIKVRDAIPSIFYILRKGDANMIQDAMRKERKRAMSTPDGVLCTDVQGRTPLHVLCEKNIAPHDETVYQTVLDMPHEILREDNTGTTPFDNLFSIGRPTLRLINILCDVVPEMRHEMAMLLRAFQRDHTEYAEIITLLFSDDDVATTSIEEKKSDTKNTMNTKNTQAQGKKTWAQHVAQVIQQQSLIKSLQHHRALEAELVSEAASVTIQRTIRGFFSRSSHRTKHALEASATTIQALSRGITVRSFTIIPGKTRLVFGLKHAVQETRRQLGRSSWIKGSLPNIPWSERRELLQNDVRTFDTDLRSHYYNLHRWMHGEVNIKKPQRVVCSLLRRLSASQGLLMILEQRHQRLFAGEEEKDRKRKESRMLLLTPLPGTKSLLRQSESKFQLQKSKLQEELKDNDPGEEIIEYKESDVRNHWAFHRLEEEDLELLQMIEDDLISLEGDDWSEGWKIEDDLWEAIDADEIEREKEEEQQKKREHIEIFEQPPVGLILEGSVQHVLVKGYEDNVSPEIRMNILVGEELVGVNKKYFDEKQEHAERMVLLGASGWPLHLIFRREEKKKEEEEEEERKEEEMKGEGPEIIDI